MVVDKLSIRPYFWEVSGVALGDPQVPMINPLSVTTNQENNQLQYHKVCFFPDMFFFQRGEDILYMLYLYIVISAYNIV